jgi:hypothetical protein
LVLVIVTATIAGIIVSGGRSTPAVGCQIVGIAFHDPRFGRPSFDRTIPCLRGFDASTEAEGRVLPARPPDLAIRRHT